MGVIGQVSTDSDSASIRILLFWPVVAYDMGICDVFKPVLWDLLFENEIPSVGAFDDTGKPLG